jgi:hypothetical protein
VFTNGEFPNEASVGLAPPVNESQRVRGCENERCSDQGTHVARVSRCVCDHVGVCDHVWVCGHVCVRVDAMPTRAGFRALCAILEKNAEERWWITVRRQHPLGPRQWSYASTCRRSTVDPPTDGRPRDRRSTPPRMLQWAKGKFGRHRLYRRITSGETRYHREVQLHKKSDFVQRRCAASMLLQCAL